jgi:putative peptidoglycan lipid II flippase
MISDARRSLALAAVSAAARVPGFVLPILVASAFGAGPDTDAYFIAYGAMLLVAGSLAQSVEVAIVPFAAREYARGQPAAAQFLGTTAWRVTGITTLAWVAVALAVVWGSAAALRPQVAMYAACFAGLLVWGAASTYAGALVAEDRIAAATGSLMWRGAGGLVGLLVSYEIGRGLALVAVGLGAGEICRLWWVRRKALVLSGGASVGSAAHLGSFSHAALAMVAAGALGGLGPVVEKLLALSLGPGAASHLEYATRILVIPAVAFDGGLAPLLLGRWSRLAVTDGRAPSSRELGRALVGGLAAAAVCAGVLAGTAPVLVRALLQHGRFNTVDAVAVGSLVRLLSVGFVGTVGALLVERAYLATGRSRVLAALTVLRVAIRISLALALLDRMGLPAFAVGYAAAEWGYLGLLLARIPHVARLHAQPLGEDEGEARA